MSNEATKDVVKGYKVFKPDWTCTPVRGNTKQYTCPGKFEEEVEPAVCCWGMHFCERLVDCFNYYDFDPNNKVAEVIAYGDVVTDGTKSCTNKLEIVRELSWEEVLCLVNTGKYNTGFENTGDYNCGNRNTGNENSGHRNTGYSNSGCRNTGYYNSGSGNVGDNNNGDENTGDGNSGYRNTGNSNDGNWNTGNNNDGILNTGNGNDGHRNTGDFNTGHQNSGNGNRGNYNTGDWNVSSHNAGCFNTETPKMLLFNKPSDWTYDDWFKSDAQYILEQLFYTVNRQEWWDELSEEDKATVKAIPNFDADIFYECTGIRVDGNE